MNSCISSPTFRWALRPYFLPEVRRLRVELPFRDELRREREGELELRDDADFVRWCPVLLRRPVAERRRGFVRDEVELFPRDFEVDLRVAIISSLLHSQTTA